MIKKNIIFTSLGVLAVASIYFLASNEFANDGAGKKSNVDLSLSQVVPIASPPKPYKNRPLQLEQKNKKIVEPKITSPELNRSHQDTYQQFNDWFGKYNKKKNDSSLIAQGVEVAKQRRVVMQYDMQNNPNQAWKNTLSYSQYDVLPVAIKALVEEPFSVQADLMVLPDESVGGGNVASIFYEKEGEKKSHKVTLFGSRKNVLSKNKLVVQGARLDSLAVIDEHSFQLVNHNDVAWAERELVLGNADKARDYYTNKEIIGNSVQAISAGKIYYFSHVDNIKKLNADINILENKSGPNSHQYHLEKMGINLPTSTVSSSSLQSELARLTVGASIWTETKKKVFFIRVDFSDKTGESVSKVNLESALNGPISTLINEFSYGKTSLEGAVDGSQVEASSQLVRLPQQGSYYKNLDDTSFPNGSVQLYNDTITAFNALNTGVNLSSFNIVGIHFASIGMGYAGLAGVGGGSHWLQATTATNVVVHEFGHNYGLSHANYWDTGGASVVGAGSEIGYGDIYDTMGNTSSGDFHMQAKALLNWIPSTEWTDVASSGTHRLYQFDQNVLNTNIKGLRLTKGVNEYYWLGYRREFSANNVLQSGAYIIWQRPSASASVLIDTTAGSSGGKEDAGISLGRTYSDSVANVHITPTNKGGSGSDEWLDVQINIGDFAGNQNPSLTLTTPNTLTARTPLTFSADASDADGDTLAYDWDFGDGVIHKNTSRVVQSWVTGGSYTIKVTVSDMKGGTATQQLSVTVTDPATQWTDRTSNVANSIVDIATDGTTAVAITNFEVIGSTDGTTWSTLSGRVAANSYTYSITYDGSQWIAVGQDYDFGSASWKGAIYTSPDASTWTERYKAGNKLRSIVSSGSVLVAVGDNGEAVRSINAGVSWSPVASNISTRLIAVAYGNSKFMAVGNQYFVGDLAAVTTSTDGLTWTNQTSISGAAKNYGYSSIAYLNDKFIGTGVNSYMGYLENSAGTEFITTRTEREISPSLIYGNGVYLASGVNQDKDVNSDLEFDNTDLISIDGKTWLASPVAVSVPVRYSGVFFKNTFITVGATGSIRQSGIITAPTTDSDSDGLDDTLEVIVPDLTGNDTGDGNGDGTQDNAQNDVTSFKANNGINWITFANTNGGMQSNIVTSSAPVTAPADKQLSLGVMQLDVTTTSGAATQIEIYVEQNTTIQDYLLLGNDGNWTAQNATVTHTGTKTKLVFSVTEGGNFDRDATANGVLQLAQGGVIVSLGLDAWPYAYLYGNVDIGQQTDDKAFTIKNTGSRTLTITGASITGNNSTEFVITANTCTTLAADETCTISASFQPNSIGSKSAMLTIITDDPDNARANIFLRNHEADKEESERRLPPVLNSFTIKDSGGSDVTSMQSNTQYTVHWSILGYHEDYTSLVVMFNCTGIADNTSCGDSYSDSSRFLTSGTVTSSSSENGIWFHGDVQSKIFNYGHTFTTPNYATSTPIVIRFYRKNSKDLQVGNGSLSLIIPGNQAENYYDTTGRRVKNVIAP